jgi:hypothetical protein
MPERALVSCMKTARLAAVILFADGCRKGWSLMASSFITADGWEFQQRLRPVWCSAQSRIDVVA